MARSKSLYGPYEVHPDNPILTAWYSPENDLQKTGHASLIKTDSEEWYIAYLASRPIKRKGKGLFEERGFCTLGRESALAKIEWTPDDWPIVTGGKVAQKYVPNQTYQSALGPANLKRIISLRGFLLSFKP